MATLYVENFPDDLYEAIREQAKKDRKSIAAEVTEALAHRYPTAAEMERREAFYKKALKMTSRKPLTPGPHPTAEEMVREDRER